MKPASYTTEYEANAGSKWRTTWHIAYSNAWDLAKEAAARKEFTGFLVMNIEGRGEVNVACFSKGKMKFEVNR